MTIFSDLCGAGNPPPLTGIGGQQIFCGRGPGRQDCPEGSYCNISPVDAYAVCCSNDDDGEGDGDGSSRPEFCSLTPETGRCRGAMRRYYFNSVTGECAIFTYGGCGGNENNFELLEECENTCKNVGVGEVSGNGEGGEGEVAGSTCPSMDDCKLDCRHGLAYDDQECNICQCLEPCKVGISHICFDNCWAILKFVP